MWIVPTLSRPAQCAAVVQRMVDMGVSSPGEVFVNGHSRWEHYEEVVRSLPKGWGIVFNKENIGALGALNRVLADHPDAKFYGFIGDDEFVETPGFDERLIAAAGDWNISHGDDGVHKGERAQGYLCVGGKLARAVGYLAIPTCWHWFGLDNMWETIVLNGGCEKVFCPDVKIDHRHPHHKKGEMDDCYGRGEAKVTEDHYEFSKWIHTELSKVLLRIGKAKANAG